MSCWAATSAFSSRRATMSKLEMAIVIVFAVTVLPAFVNRAQARSGPAAFHADVKNANEAGELQSAHPANIELQNVDLPKVQLNESNEVDSDEEPYVFCTETGTCEQKRVLTASIDYRNDGPNDPITDPPH